MIQPIPHTNQKMADNIMNIQYRSYKVEAELIDFQDLPPLKETPQTIMSSDEHFIGYFIKEKLVGVLSYKNDEGLIDIYRLMVDPDHFRKGVAQSLLTYIKTTYPDKKMIVHTGSENEPALNLYAKNGFERVGEVEVSADVFITRLETSS